tara:strand:+ start:216 stop:326 length:111 start_codon:yes stop_codon:yes gene_type:complete
MCKYQAIKTNIKNIKQYKQTRNINADIKLDKNDDPE